MIKRTKFAITAFVFLMSIGLGQKAWAMEEEDSTILKSIKLKNAAKTGCVAEVKKFIDVIKQNGKELMVDFLYHSTLVEDRGIKYIPRNKGEGYFQFIKYFDEAFFEACDNNNVEVVRAFLEEKEMLSSIGLLLFSYKDSICCQALRVARSKGYGDVVNAIFLNEFVDNEIHKMPYEDTKGWW